MDLRPFRMLWEHKKVLREHIIKFMEETQIDKNDFIVKINDKEEVANKVFQLVKLFFK